MPASADRRLDDAEEAEQNDDDQDGDNGAANAVERAHRCCSCVGGWLIRSMGAAGVWAYRGGGRHCGRVRAVRPCFGQ